MEVRRTSPNRERGAWSAVAIGGALACLVAVPPGAGEPAAPWQVQEFGCSQDIGFFLLPIGGLQARLPPGFAALPADPAGLLGAVFVATLDCADVAVDGHAAGPARESGTGILVVPPAAWQEPGIDTYAVAAFVNTAGPVADAFRAWGIGGAGEVTLVQPEADAAGVALALGASEGTRFAMMAATEGAPMPSPAAHIRAFGVAGGEVAGVVDLLATPNLRRGGLPGGEGVPGQAVVAFDPGPYETPVLEGFAQHAAWQGLALQWDRVV